MALGVAARDLCEIHKVDGLTGGSRRIERHAASPGLAVLTRDHGRPTRDRGGPPRATILDESLMYVPLALAAHLGRPSPPSRRHVEPPGPSPSPTSTARQPPAKTTCAPSAYTPSTQTHALATDDASRLPP